MRNRLAQRLNASIGVVGPGDATDVGDIDVGDIRQSVRLTATLVKGCLFDVLEECHKGLRRRGL